MRISSRMMVENAIQYMDDNLARLSELQTRIASGKAFQSASDDPTVAVASLSLRSTLETNQAYLDTGAVSRDWLNATELALKEMVDIGTRAQTLAVAGLSDTNGAGERDALALDIEGLLQQAVGVGNTMHQDKYLFSGYAVKQAPFTYTAPAGIAQNLASTSGPLQHSIAPGQQPMTVNLDGNAVFWPMLEALQDVYNALQPATYNPATLQTALNDLNTALTTVKDARTTNGSRQRHLDTELDRLEKTKLALKDLLNHREDANLAESISLLQHQETVYQAVLQVGSRSVMQNLFSYLR